MVQYKLKFIRLTSKKLHNWQSAHQMEITRTNFEQDLNLVLESITNADFVAIDTEFSGKTLD